MNEITRKLLKADREYLWHPFTQMANWLADEQVVIDSGEGFYLIDTEGRRYIDGVSSLWCNVHGHRVEHIDNAIRGQLDKISHSTLLGLSQTRAAELAEKLVRITPDGLNKVFYSDSGATSVEIALKMAFQYYHNIRRGREKFIALRNSYHGDTIGSVSVGGIDVFHGIFNPLLFAAEFIETPFPYRFEGTAEQCRDDALDRLEQVLNEHEDNVAAVVVEPLVQGAAGMIVHPQGFLRGVRELTRKYETMLIADEVATGFGRTGKMFACEHEQVTPDLMCLAKGITGGYLPLAATMATDEIYDAFLGGVSEHKTFYHGHTYTGNALGCAAAIASLELFEKKDIIASMTPATELMRGYMQRFAAMDFVGDVRGRGLMGGVEIVSDKATGENFDYSLRIGARLCTKMRARGAMMRPLGDVIILMPPPAMDIELLGELMEIIEVSLREDLPVVIEETCE